MTLTAPKKTGDTETPLPPPQSRLNATSKRAVEAPGLAAAAAPVISAKNGLRGALGRFRTDRTLRRWCVAWLGAPVLAIANGAARELTYKDHIGESAANQISVAPLLALLAFYFWVLQRRWPLGSRRDALSIGAVWVALSVLFEFGFGHYVEGDSWADLFENYDVTAGNIWILILLGIAGGPATVRAIAGERR